MHGNLLLLGTSSPPVRARVRGVGARKRTWLCGRRFVVLCGFSGCGRCGGSCGRKVAAIADGG